MRRPGVIAGIAVAILAVTLWRFTQPTPSRDLRLTPLTFDPGLTGWPAISSDGHTIAYASDRDSGNNLDLYVQPIPGGNPVRITDTEDDESEPAFSPDGATLAFHSTEAGGGIYTMPSTGGQARLIAAGGRTPRYSSDGRWIAFWTESDASSAAFVIAASGGTPRPFHPELASLRAPTWSPDGHTLLVWSSAGPWAAPVDGGAAESTGIGERIAKANLGPGPFDDGIWTTEGFLFSARTGFVRNLYRCPLNSHGKAKGDVVQLTDGTELMGDAAVSRDGHMVLASARQRYDIWGLPLDASLGKATGALYRITDSLAPTANPSITPDGRTLLYGSSRNGFTQVWQKDLPTGKESVAATSAEGASYGRLTASGRILYVQPLGGHNDVYLLDPKTHESRKLASGSRPWDVDSKEQIALLSGTGIDTLDLRSGRRVPVLRPPEHTTLAQASFSPDGRWILFLAVTGKSARLYVARFQGVQEIPADQWLAMSDGVAKVDKPHFSPDGGIIYFTLDRGETRTIEAQRFDPQSGHPVGQPFSVFDRFTPRLSLFAVNSQAQEIAIARDKLIMILGEQTSNIWMADLVRQ